MPTVDELEKDLNGFGNRLHTVELDNGKQEVRLVRAEQDIQDTWKAVDSIRTDVTSVKESMSKLAVKVAWIVGAITAVSTVVSYALSFVNHGG